MDKARQIRVGISLGDINGVGPEVVLKTFKDQRMFDFCTPIVFGSLKTISFHKKQTRLNMVGLHGIDKPSQAIESKVNVVNIAQEAPNVAFGKLTKEAGSYALASLKAAVTALQNKEIDVLVTAPIHKENIQTEDFAFPGHTNFLAQELKGDSLMFMISDTLRVGLLTDHLPIAKVSQAITPALVASKIETIAHCLQQDFRIRKPKIAVLGINPHCGDNGVIGTEDDKVLKPVIKEMFDKGTMVFGPYPADSFFGSEQYQKFDAVIASYHDQGLTPFKTLSFGKGVNYTAGLSRVRTSPDHGTAFDIAGKGIADSSSFREAVFTAVQVFKNREEYELLTQKPLQKMQR